MRTRSNRAGFSQRVWRESPKRIARAVLSASFPAWLIALVSVGIANLARMPAESLLPTGARYASKTESSAPYERAYLPRAFASAGTSGICTLQTLR